MPDTHKRGPLRALFGRHYSLRTGLTALILLGTLIAAMVFVVLQFALKFAINRYYASEKNKLEREVRICTELQSFITSRDLSVEDLDRITQWSERNRYVYLLLYKDDELIFSSGDGDEGSTPGTGGITVDLPTEEELLGYAQAGKLYPLNFSDGTVACSIAEYTEYFYLDAANLISVVAAVISFALIIIVYFQRITARISRLATDVAKVADGDMLHVIRADEPTDEITDLCRHVEHMRSSIVHTLESEREAVNANTELITAMSHDIRTPLTVLLGYLDLMKLRADEESLSYVRAAEATAIRLKELSDDIFRYFVAYGQSNEVKVQAYEADVLLEQLLAEHILLLREKGYTVERTEPLLLPSGTMLYTDAPQLMRIIDNIFSNIGKYADPNSPVFMDISLENERICLHFSNKIRADGEQVESTGIGLRSCSRIASSIGAAFTVSREGDVFTASVGLSCREEVAP